MKNESCEVKNTFFRDKSLANTVFTYLAYNGLAINAVVCSQFSASYMHTEVLYKTKQLCTTLYSFTNVLLRIIAHWTCCNYFMGTHWAIFFLDIYAYQNMKTTCMFFIHVLCLSTLNRNKTGVINDPLGQTHILASSQMLCLFEICFALKSGDGRTTCAKTMITTGRDCGTVDQ